MKISKIFHTLYGFLMCLPIISILFVCVYVSVNPNAKDSYSGTEIQYRQVEYHTNVINPFDNFVVGNVYNLYFQADGHQYNLIDEGFDFPNCIVLGYYLDINEFYPIGIDEYYTEGQFCILRNFAFCNFNISSYGVYAQYYTYYVDDTDYSYISLEFYVDSQPLEYHSYLQVVCTDELYSYLEDTNFYFSSFFKSADLSLIPPQYEQVEVQKLDNAFYYSVNEINDNPLFSWAQNSFLVAPITYVVSLFGMTNNSPIVTMLSYWLTISIIWLVFDLIMYIPLLVHRWIDKGVVE